MGEHTPTPWRVRTHERNGELRDCFIAAPDVNGFAYDAEILGDDEYRSGIERKLADCRFIVTACNNHAELIEALRKNRVALIAIADSAVEAGFDRLADIIDEQLGTTNALLARIEGSENQ